MPVGNYVIGSDLSALLFAHYNDCAVITTRRHPPKPFEFINLPSYTLGMKGVTPSRSLWSALVLTMSLDGEVLGGAPMKHVKIDEESIKVKISGVTRKQLEYEKCFIFDTSDIEFDAEVRETKEQKFIVHDWVDVRTGAKHDHEKLVTGDDFLSEANFYISTRIDGNKDRKDVICTSIMNADQLQDFEYSDTMIRFKLEKLMADVGIQGPVSGKSHARIKLDTRMREIRKLENVYYEETEKMSFIFNKGPQEIIDGYYRPTK